ncbi:MAG: beta-N-acetylhexosaminidase [Thermoproteota archaeon]
MSSKEKNVKIVPEPKRLEFSGKWFDFDGLDLPNFLSREFGISKGRWRIRKIESKGNGVRVIGEDREILIWGDEKTSYATVIQLLKQRTGSIPEVVVEEEFRFKFRCFHLDIARGGVPKLETFKKILRWLFLLKYNYFAIYFEDLFPWEKHPDIGVHRGRLSREEYMEIVSYGRELGIEVFPSLELAGHMEHILSLPEYWRFGEWHNPAEGCLDVSSDEARSFAYDLLKEAVEKSPSKHIHIGGDETWAMGRGRSLDKTWSFRGPELYETHHREMVNIVRGSGKTPIIWGDMLTGMYLREEEKDKWSKVAESPIWDKAIIANWDYSPTDEEYFRRKMGLFRNRGKQVVCPGLSNWNRYYPNFKTAVENMRNFLSAARKEGVYGFMLTAWGDDGEECLFSFLDPLILACMEYAEGNGEWEEKWMALTGEPREVLDARKAFGEPELSENLKHVLFADRWYYRMSMEERETLRSNWNMVLERLNNIVLPRDLEFIRDCVKVGLRRLCGEAKPSDFIYLSNNYSRFWLSERKPEGLERIIERLWGAAGRIDGGLR